MTGFLTSCKSNVNDGGQWDVVVNLLGTYGVIPGFLFRDSRTGTESCPLNKIVITHLRADVMLQCNLYPEFQVSASAQGTLKVMRVDGENGEGGMEYANGDIGYPTFA